MNDRRIGNPRSLVNGDNQPRIGSPQTFGGGGKKEGEPFAAAFGLLQQLLGSYGNKANISMPIQTKRVVGSLGSNVHVNINVYSSIFGPGTFEPNGVLSAASFELIGEVKVRYGIVVYARYFSDEAGIDPDDTGLGAILVVEVSRNMFGS